MKPGDEILIRAKLINVRQRDNEVTVGFDSTSTAVIPLKALRRVAIKRNGRRGQRN